MHFGFPSNVLWPNHQGCPTESSTRPDSELVGHKTPSPTGGGRVAFVIKIASVVCAFNQPIWIIRVKMGVSKCFPQVCRRSNCSTTKNWGPTTSSYRPLVILLMAHLEHHGIDIHHPQPSPNPQPSNPQSTHVPATKTNKKKTHTHTPKVISPGTQMGPLVLIGSSALFWGVGSFKNRGSFGFQAVKPKQKNNHHPIVSAWQKMC